MNRLDQKREEYAIVLDFLPNGYPASRVPSHRKTAIAQAIGKNFLSLLEGSNEAFKKASATR